LPRAAAPDDWVPGLRRGIRAFAGAGWSISPHRGKPRLQVVHDDGTREAVALPYRWDEADAADLLLRVRQLYRAVVNGQTLKGAAAIADAASSKSDPSWAAAVDAYRDHKVAIEGRCSERNWETKYAPVLAAVVALQTGTDRAVNAADLADAILRRWEPGSRARQISRQVLSGFLRYAVERRQFKACWVPPPPPREQRKAKAIGYPLRDEQILLLLDHLPATAAAERWRFAIQLSAVYGLRPEELRHLVIRDEALWCMYRKATGGGRTEPRELHPLLVRGDDGKPLDWRLQQRVATGEELPPLGAPGHAGEAVGTYLKRLKVWADLKADAERSGEALSPYSLRHRYARQSHLAGIPAAQIAAAMGHSLEVHLQSYARFQPGGVGSAYSKANAPI
jgi:integrase